MHPENMQRPQDGVDDHAPDSRDHPPDPRGGEVIKGTLDLLALQVLRNGPMHGWGITELIEQRSDNLLSVNQGSLYPALYRLVRRGLLRSTWRQTENNRRARYYELTAEGRAALGEERATWERLSRGVNLVLAGGPGCEL